MNRIHLYLILDTETANTIDCPICYNIAWCIIDQHGNVYAQGSFINSDVFYGMVDLMQTAYYADKIPQYMEAIENGEITVASWYEIRKALCEIIEEYDCKFVIAHNARFDYNALNNTQRWTTKSKYRHFLPRGLEWWDTLKIARSVMGQMPTYRKFCEENGYLTKTGRLRFTAEICYRFITKDNTFKESHTGLEDVKIESEILAYCHRQHKAMKKKLWGN